MCRVVNFLIVRFAVGAFVEVVLVGYMRRWRGRAQTVLLRHVRGDVAVSELTLRSQAGGLFLSAFLLLAVNRHGFGV